MRLKYISLAVIAAAGITNSAFASVSVTPIIGHSYVKESQDKQVKVYQDTSGAGIKLNADLYKGAAVGVDIKPGLQVQVEYGQIDTKTSTVNQDQASQLKAKQSQVSGNLLIGKDDGHSKNVPYVLLGVGESTNKITDKDTSTVVIKDKSTIGNVGFGMHHHLNNHLALRGEVRGVYNFEHKWWDGVGLAGLQVSFSGGLSDKKTDIKPLVPTPDLTPVVTVKQSDIEFVPILPTPKKSDLPIEIIDGDDDKDGVLNSKDACPNTPINLVVDERGCPKQIKVAEQLQLQLRVFFDKDKTDIKPQFYQEIEKVADAMNDFPNSTAIIEGHASRDSARSKAQYNQRLSEARANAVKAMLTNEFGVDANRLTAIGYGFDRPMFDNKTEQGRALNRRVLAVIEGERIQTVEKQK